MKQYIFLMLVIFSLIPMTSCSSSSTEKTEASESVQTNQAEIDAQRQQDSIREAQATAERLKREEEARIAAEKEAKKWKGVATLSELKDKLPGTTWGATRKRGDFYFKFHFTTNSVIITSYTKSDFSEDSRFGGTEKEKIEDWRPMNNGSGFMVVSCEEGIDRNSIEFQTGFAISKFVFAKNSPTVQWIPAGDNIPLKQIED